MEHDPHEASARTFRHGGFARGRAANSHAARPDCPISASSQRSRDACGWHPGSRHRRKENLIVHKFNIGQIVELEPNLLRSIASGPYEILKLIPAPDRD